MKKLWFDGQPSTDFGMMITGESVYDAAERDVEKISVAGRNGDLTIDNGRYKNIPVSYPASICQNFVVNAEKARTWLGSKIGYCRLEDDYDPDHYRMGRFQGPLRFTPGFLNRTGECVLTFDCMPQRFLKAGEQVLSVANGGILFNPTTFPALPLIAMTVTGDAGGVFTLGGCAVKITCAAGTRLYLDCEQMDAYSITDAGAKVNQNGSISAASFPVLMPGNSALYVEDDIGAVEITPRWWTL